jgi:MFS-type transporter involved in bile tolerance (Atg22 family)
MIHRHYMSFIDWVFALSGIITGVALLCSLPWAIRAQRRYDRSAVSAVVRTLLLLGIACLIGGLGYIFNGWGVLASVAIMIFGVMIPSAISRRRAASRALETESKHQGPV